MTVKRPWETDAKFEELTVRGTKPYDTTHFEVQCQDGRCLLVHNRKKLPVPQPGSLVKFFGDGLGRPVRGVVSGVYCYYYSTEKDYDIAQEKAQYLKNKKTKAKWSKNWTKYQKQVKALPPEFQDRINRFLKKKDWGWTFGDYELFSCKEAVKLAQYLDMDKAKHDIFRKLSHDKQNAEAEKARMKVHEHSGNTYGMAVQLAWIWIANPELVAKFHGALCPMVGCKEYGCWSSSPEAKKERAKNV